ncbi:MAG: hypothetical protein SNG27_07340 [Rikenellaceae bacterium]
MLCPLLYEVDLVTYSNMPSWILSSILFAVACLSLQRYDELLLSIQE